MSVKLLTEHSLEFLSFKGGCTGSSESTLVKMSHCWKSHVAAHIYIVIIYLCLLARFIRNIMPRSANLEILRDKTLFSVFLTK